MMAKCLARSSVTTLHSSTPPANPTYLVADSALYSAENLHKLADTSLKWITRVPATLTEAQEVLAQAQPATMPPLQEGYRYAVLASQYGGVAQRWVLIYSEHRQPQAQRTVDTQWLKQSDQEAKAFKRLCRTAFACETDAQQALSRFVAGLQTTFLHDSTVCPTPHYGKRGRPGPGAQPAQLVYHIAGALASRPTERRARVDHQAVLSSQRTNWTRASYPPRRCSTDTKGKPRRNVDFASSKTRNFWPLLSILKSPSASWPC